MRSRRRRSTRRRSTDRRPQARPEPRRLSPSSESHWAPGSPRLGGTAAIVFLGAMVTAWSAWLLTGRDGPVAAAGRADPHLAPAPDHRLLQYDRGSGGSRDAVPVRGAAQPAGRAAARPPRLLIVAWAMSGLPPFHRQLVTGRSARPPPHSFSTRIGVEARCRRGSPTGERSRSPSSSSASGSRRSGGGRLSSRWQGGLLGLLSLDPDGIAGGYLLLAAAIGIEVQPGSMADLAGRIALDPARAAAGSRR